jgi:hypothetical protein
MQHDLRFDFVGAARVRSACLVPFTVRFGRLVTLLVLLSAQTQLVDDFEGSLLRIDVPPGVWFGFANPRANVSMQVAGGCGYGGNACLRLTDRASSAGAENSLIVTSELSGAGRQRSRFWFRPTIDSPGIQMAFAFISINSGISTAVESVYFFANRQLGIQCWDGLSIPTIPSTRVPAPTGWMLVELATEGVGTNNGQCALALNGVEVARQTGLNWSGRSYNGHALGQNYGERSFTGALDYDNYRISRSPIPSRITLSANPASATTAECREVTIEFHESFAAATVPLIDQASVTFFDDNNMPIPAALGDCLMATVNTQPIAVMAGRDTARIRLRPTRATSELRVAESDLVGITVPWNVVVATTPDAGQQPTDAGQTDAGQTDAGQTDGRRRRGRL